MSGQKLSLYVTERAHFLSTCVFLSDVLFEVADCTAPQGPYIYINVTSHTKCNYLLRIAKPLAEKMVQLTTEGALIR